MFGLCASAEAHECIDGDELALGAQLPGWVEPFVRVGDVEGLRGVRRDQRPSFLKQPSLIVNAEFIERTRSALPLNRWGARFTSGTWLDAANRGHVRFALRAFAG